MAKIRLTGICFALFALLVSVGLPSAATAGAWTQAKGSVYNRLAVNYAVITEQFDASGNRVAAANNGEFTEWNITYYGEGGLTDRLTIVGSLPLKFLQDQSETGFGTRTLRNTGFGDLDLGVRYRLLSEPTVVSVLLLGKFPYLYDENRDPATGPATGSGQVDTEVRVLVGRSLYPYGYGGIEFGYRYRAEEPSDEYRYLVEYGLSFTPRIYARTKLDGIKSARNADQTSGVSAGGNPTLSPEFDIGKLELTAGYAHNRNWSGEVTYTGVLYGKDIGAGNMVQLALVYAF
ncbi:MAG: hypothetical protein HY207_02910 [Nitrospirae bacterium]|nr:hypothetical protein [Nitrospirota bacterium]